MKRAGKTILIISMFSCEGWSIVFGKVRLGKVRLGKVR